MKKSREKISELKALSIAQPWATCIVSKGKNIENRSWDTKFRGYVAIHASKSKDLSRFEYCEEKYKCGLNPENVDFGAIVGIAEIVNVVTKKSLKRETKKWFQGEFGFHLKNIIKLKKPIKINGALGFWKVNNRVIKQILSQLTEKQIKKVSSNLLAKI